jgi:hypothetical protein
VPNRLTFYSLGGMVVAGNEERKKRDSMKLFRKIFAAILIGAITLNTGCVINNSKTSRNVVYKGRDEIETDVESYLKEKYGKEFIVAVTDSPNHIYSSYEVSAYAADDESKTSCSVTITYVDEENYYVTDDYFMYSISDDLEVWFKELADPYIDCDFKAFWRSGLMDLSSDYDDCKTAEDFLELSPTASYYSLRFLIVLPSQMADSDIAAMTDNIASDMLEKRIRCQITTIVFVDEVVYDQINSKEDEREFWINEYKNVFCTSTIRGNFNFAKSEIQKGGFWHLDDETYNKRFEN